MKRYTTKVTPLEPAICEALRAGEKVADIARRFGLHNCTIDNVRRRNGIAPRIKCATIVDPSLRASVVAQLRAGVKQTAIAGVTNFHVRKIAAEERIPTYSKVDRRGVAAALVDPVLRRTASVFGVSVFRLAREHRGQPHESEARQAAYVAMIEGCGLKPIEVAHAFSGRHHSTVQHAVKKISERRAEDPAFDRKMRRLIAAVQSIWALEP